MDIREEAFEGKPISAPVIDAHTHILPYYNMGWYQSVTSNADIIALLDHLGINCIVTAPHSLVLGEMEYTNEAAAKAAEEFPNRIYGYIVVSPHEGMAAVSAALEKYSKNKNFVGLKFIAGYHGPLACPEYDYALDFADEMGCPVLCHIWDNSPTLNDVERAAKARPSLKLIMAHQGGGAVQCTDAYVKLMENYPNLLMEICGSLNNQYSMEAIVEKAGEDRVIYGSDLINLDPRFDFGRVVFSILSDKTKRKVLAGNYLRTLEGSGMGQINIK